MTPRVWAGGPLSTSHTRTDSQPTGACDPVPTHLRKSPPAAGSSTPQESHHHPDLPA